MTQISIIVPCYNQAQYLGECLESVLNQNFQEWECIIVNDGSTDNTDEIASIWIQKDNRFKYIHKQNGGLSSARNAGIEIAVGEFILPLDADDKISANYCKFALAEFQKDDNLKVVYCKAEKFGTQSGLWILQDFSLENLAISNVIFCSALFKKLDWKLVGGYDVNMIYGYEDWDLWISILKNGGKVKKIDEIGFFYRVKSDSMVKSLTDEKKEMMQKIIGKKHSEFFIDKLGSFTFLLGKIKENQDKSTSEKFIINTMLNKYFGFKIFKL